MKRASFVLCSLLAAARPGAAQQFQQVGTGLPGPVVWSEGVEAFDADGDGRIDVLFANGNGYSSAGGALAPTLLINQTSGGGPITFADQTAARFPAGFTQQAKGLIVCDVDGDGDQDVIFTNAFGNQPTILINDGTGHFTNETALRFPVVSLNSFGGGFGDVDGDGDIDLVFTDEGPNTFASPGGKARLFINDGTGHFTDSAAFLAVAVNKVGAQNAQMVDIDNDFDLDIVVDGKSTNQQLYINDGTGHYTLQTSNTIPAGSSATYATDWSDLDNDNDIDGFYISLSGFDEGTARNNLGGNPAFTGTTATVTPQPGDDDNDVVFLDANGDGIQDVIVGSLSGSQEKLYLNAGTFNNNSFVYQANGFSAVTDSTLDLAVGDFDGDGRYDVVTAQGESGNFTNRVYRNTGPVDTVAPRIGRVEPTPPRVPLSVIQNGGLARRAWVQDATYKRGQTFAAASLEGTAEKDGSVQSFSVPMMNVGGGIYRGAIHPASSPTGTVGMDVTFAVHATDPSANASDSAPATFRICGAEAYGPAVPNSTGSAAHMIGVNDPSIGANDFSMTITGLPPNASGVLMLGRARLLPGAPFGNGLRFVVGYRYRRDVPAAANASGVATVAVDFTQPPFAGVHPGETQYFQLEYADPPAGGARFNASDALEITFCD
jgi:hypothetical protein